MPDLEIPQIPFVTDAENLERGDLVLIDRAGAGAAARIDGKLLVPNFTAADAGKIFEVSSTGELVLANKSATSAAWALRANASGLNNQVAGTAYTHTFPSAFDYTDYTDLLCNFTLSSGEIISVRTAPLLNIQQVSDGWRAWWSGTRALTWVRPTGSSTAGQVHVYGRVG